MRVAIITGASRGLGLALARGLAERDWRLVIDGRDTEALADAAHRAALVDAADALGGASLLVNNAGILGPSPQPRLADYPTDELARVYDVDVLAPHALLREALPLLRRSGGAVVNVSSDAAVEAYEGWGGYGSAKAALDHLSAVLAAEEPAVGVYAFDPGDMRTAMHQAAFPGEDISDRPQPGTVAVPGFRALLLRRPPSGRYRATDLLLTAGTAR